MHSSYWLTNFAGESLPLQQLMPEGSIPTGTGGYPIAEIGLIARSLPILWEDEWLK